jgi:hypothetical protein
MTARKAIKADELHSELIRHKDVSITAAQLLAMNATPQTLVAAPAAGFVNIFEGAFLVYDYVTAFTATIRDLEIRYTGTSGQLCCTAITGSGFLDATSDQIRHAYPVFSATFTPVVADKIVICCKTGELGTGTSVMRIRTFYRRVATGL